MNTETGKKIVHDVLHSAGIAINGNRPWDIQIKNEKFYRRILSDGRLGLGESYMEGWWECEKLDDFFCRLISSRPEDKIRKNWKAIVQVLGAAVLNRGSRSRAYQVGKRHYDIGNELYKHMLDRRMVYSCAYWNGSEDLDAAQEAKLDLICRKLGLCPGDRVLDIGCGWGGFAAYASEKYHVEVVGITVSKEQAELGRERCKGLPVEIRLQDYRDIREQFDHIISVGMFEHVGCKNYRAYMATAHRCLKDNGLFLLHTIGKEQAEVANDPWFDKYIFPNYLIPSMKQIGAAIKKLFIVEDWHNFGADYDATLMAWFRNVESSWGTLKEAYGEQFKRMWRYYLMSCAAAFRARQMHVWQIVLSKNGVPGGYRSIR